QAGRSASTAAGHPVTGAATLSATSPAQNGCRPHHSGAESTMDTSGPSTRASSPARASTPAGVPSTSTATVTGARGPAGTSTSTATGAAGDASTAPTSSPAWRGVATSRHTYRRAEGSGCRRNVAAVITASVPYEPHSSRPTSYPATFLTTRPPERAGTPSARTNSTPISRSR